MTAPGSGHHMRPSGRRSVPFSVTLASSVALLIVVAVASVLGLQWWVGRTNTLELLRDKAQMIVDRIEVGVRNHLDPAVHQVEYIGALLERSAVDVADGERLSDVLIGSFAATPQIQGIAVWSRDLQQTLAWRGPDGAIEIVRRDQSDEAELRSALAEAAQAESAYWGDLVTRGKAVLINLRRPIRRDGELVGLLVSAITVRELSQMVSETGDLFEATAFILAGGTEVLAHPFLATSDPEADAQAPTIPLGRFADVVLSGLWEGVSPPEFEDATGGDVQVVVVPIGTLRYVSLYKWVTGYGPVPWALGAWLPMAEVDRELTRLMWAGLAGLAVLLIAVLAAVLLGRGMARPIRRAAEGAALVGELDLARVQELPRSWIRELDDQARAFNTMLASLRSFETYVPRSLVKRLVHAGSGNQIRSRERDLTILFTDVVAFTSASERLSAAEVATFLNRHFALLGACVEAEGGTVDKFIGDALMAFWGAPEKQKARAVRACRAALAMAEAIADDNHRRRAAGQDPVRLRIGIHTGRVVVGNIGWPGRINYTIVGDAVNTCQRLEALGRELDRGDAVTILVSGATAARLDGAFRLEPAGRFAVKGKTTEVEVFRLLP